MSTNTPPVTSTNSPINKKHIFLGGTCNGSKWRDDLLSLLDPRRITCYNPVVPDWTEAHKIIERKQREECDVCLYAITPRMVGVYSIAEAVDDSNKRPDKTVFCFLEVDDTRDDDNVSEKNGSSEIKEATNDCRFDQRQVASLKAVGQMIEANGGVWIRGGLKDLAVHLNAL